MMHDNSALLVGATLIIVVLAVGGYLVIRDTLRRQGNWGINLTPVHCPQCHELVPAVRVPANRRQALWGGATCVKCGCEMDKWGNIVE
jgi:hypothetical protein